MKAIEYAEVYEALASAEPMTCPDPGHLCDPRPAR